MKEIKINDCVFLTKTEKPDQIRINMNFPDPAFLDEGLQVKLHADVNINDLMKGLNEIVSGN